jgi:hypothetical protein
VTVPFDPAARVDWLLQQITDDEETARACFGASDLARHLNGAPLPRWERDGWQIRSTDEYRIVRVGHTWTREADHIIRWDPERVLAWCQAQRLIVDAYLDERARRDAYQSDELRATEDAEQTVRRRSSAARCRGLEIAVEALAAFYADRPGYQEEWAL